MVVEKVDFKKTLKHLYSPNKDSFRVVEVPEMQFLMADGQGIRIPPLSTSRPFRPFIRWHTGSNL